ncbi:hypothetical protein ACFQZT_18395 [Paenibacillus sp. GCM10027628]|uniref:hypothetical protein n=1 Tax=Paenibacillus sp. GCM10027628 TaxID=3273413 RepID=UPI0036375DDC
MTVLKIGTIALFAFFQWMYSSIQPERPITELSYVEVFQPSTERVILRFPCTEQVRHETTAWLKSITSLSGRFTIEPPKDGLVVHVPLKPPLSFSHFHFSHNLKPFLKQYHLLPYLKRSQPDK